MSARISALRAVLRTCRRTLHVLEAGAVIQEVDTALKTLVQREIGTRDVEVVLDAPTREWAGRRSGPTVDIYLYDIREDLRRRTVGSQPQYNERRQVVGRLVPPRYYKLSYLISAWTKRPEDEHRLLSALLSCFLAYPVVPAELVTGSLATIGEPLELTVALPPPQDRAFADVWSALGGELKPSIDLVTTVPIVTGLTFETGPLVIEPLTIDARGRYGWPGVETKVNRSPAPGAALPDQAVDRAPVELLPRGAASHDGLTRNGDSDG